MMEPMLLRHFVTVIQQQSFSKAAELLNTNQSVISRSIKRLEDHLGTLLIMRNTRTMALTEAGRALFADAIEILDRLAVATNNARRIGSGLAAEIRIAICPTTETHPVVRGITAFRELWPDVDLKLQAMMSDLQPKALRASQIDIGIMVSGIPSYEGLQWSVVARPWLGVAVPRAWNFPDNQPLEVSALTDRPLLLPERHNAPTWYDGIFDICKRAGFEPKIAGIVENPMILRIMVACGIGAAFIHSRGEFISQDDIQYMPLAGDPVYLPGETIVACSEGANAPQIKGLVDCLVNAWAEDQADGSDPIDR